MSDPAAAPGPKDIIGGAFSAAAETYDQVIGFFAPFGRALVAAADLSPGDRVLDLACGRGACLYPAVEAVGPSGRVLGLDLAPGMVARLTQELDAAGIANAQVEVGDAEALPLDDGSVDAALAGFLIFFAPEPPRVLRELHRVIRPGGRVALSIFDGPGGFPFVPDLAEELFGEPAPHRPSDEFNKVAVLVPALEAAGFAGVDVVRVVERFTFDSPEQVEAWMRSHGGRMLFERLDDLQLERCRGLLAEHLEAHRIDGGFQLVQQAAMVTATRP